MMTTNSNDAVTTTDAAATAGTEPTKKLSKKDLRSIFWRSCMLDGSWNYERSSTWRTPSP